MTDKIPEPKFSKGDLVFGKVKGFPFWPARVDEVHLGAKGAKKPLYTLFFFGTYDRGIVKEEFVRPFKENEEALGVKSNRANFGVAMEEIRKQPDLLYPNRAPDPKLPEPLDDSSDSNAGPSGEDLDNYDQHVVRAACGEYVNIAVDKNSRDSDTEKCIQTLILAIESGNYLPKGVKRRLEDRQKLAKEAAEAAKKKRKPGFPGSTREIDLEYLKMETWLSHKFVKADGILKEFREANKIENKDAKERKCRQLTRDVHEVVKEVLESKQLKLMSPLVLLKNPNIFHTIRSMDHGHAGEDDAFRDDVASLYSKAAAIFGLEEKQSFMKAFIVRKKKFDKAISHLPVKQRLLLTHDPTFFKDYVPAVRDFELMFPDRPPYPGWTANKSNAQSVNSFKPNLALVKPEPVEEPDLLSAAVGGEDVGDVEEPSTMQSWAQKKAEEEELPKRVGLAETKEGMSSLIVPKMEPMEAEDDEY